MPFDFSPTETKTNTVADVLRRAKALIDAPEKWLHRKGYGNWEQGIGPFCGIGALWVAGRGVGEPSLVAQKILNEVVRPTHFSAFNDDPRTTHADVMAAFDVAISLAESGQP